MPIIRSTFRPPAFLGNGHVQTILPALLGRRVSLDYTRERLELPDGDFLDLDWARAGHQRVVVISHGLEGSAADDYVRGMAASLNAAGWDALAWNFRGCSGEPNRLPRFYHSGETGDLGAVISRAARDYARIALVGFSLGGNMTLKYLGEPRVHPSIVAGIGISVPVDLAASARVLDLHWANGIYLWRFMRKLTAKVRAKALRFPDQIPEVPKDNVPTFAQFDGRYTAPLHGFRDADDYWRRSSSRQFIPRIKVPTLLINARNDPFLAPACYPFSEAHLNPMFYLETPRSGGHCGFLDRCGRPWAERRVVEFLISIQGIHRRAVTPRPESSPGATP
jgi:predicted alpha/beta-fold hydrolase